MHKAFQFQHVRHNKTSDIQKTRTRGWERALVAIDLVSIADWNQVRRGPALSV
jgi:hypothetical protein